MVYEMPENIYFTFLSHGVRPGRKNGCPAAGSAPDSTAIPALIPANSTAAPVIPPTAAPIPDAPAPHQHPACECAGAADAAAPAAALNACPAVADPAEKKGCP